MIHVDFKAVMAKVQVLDPQRNLTDWSDVCSTVYIQFEYSTHENVQVISVPQPLLGRSTIPLPSPKPILRRR